MKPSLLCVLFCCVFVGSFATSTSSTFAEDVEPNHPQVVYLHTEWEPFIQQSRKSREQNGDPNKMGRLTRELVRQAFMVTLTEEFAVTVRDRTLWETPPEAKNVIHLAALTRRGNDKQWKVKLYRLKPDQDVEFMFNIPARLWLQAPQWEKTFDYKRANHSAFSSGAQIMEAASRSDFVDALKEIGLKKQDRDRSARHCLKTGF